PSRTCASGVILTSRACFVAAVSSIARGFEGRGKTLFGCGVVGLRVRRVRRRSTRAHGVCERQRGRLGIRRRSRRRERHLDFGLGWRRRDVGGGERRRRHIDDEQQQRFQLLGIGRRRGGRGRQHV